MKTYMQLCILFIISVGCYFDVSASNFILSADSTITIYRVQISATTTEQEASIIQSDLNRLGITFTMIEPRPNREWWRVLAGPWPSKSEATTTRNYLQTIGFPDAFIVTTDISYEKATGWQLPIENTYYREILFETDFLNRGTSEDLFTQATNNWNQSAGIDTTKIQIALSYFGELINRYPGLPQSQYARLSIGKIYSEMYIYLRRCNLDDETNRRKYLTAAVDVLSEFLNFNPDPSKAALARKQIGDCLHLLSNYQTNKLWKTAEAYQSVLSHYSTGSIAPEAHLLYAGVLFELALNNAYSWDSVRYELSRIRFGYPQLEKWIQSRVSNMLAETYLFEFDFPKVISGAEQTLKSYSDISTDAVLAYYLIGRANLEQSHYTEALEQFRYILSTYTENTGLDDFSHHLSGFNDFYLNDPMIKLCRSASLFGQARCAYALEDTVLFNQSIQEIFDKYPKSQEIKYIQNLWGLSPSNSQFYVEDISPYPEMVFAPRGEE